MVESGLKREIVPRTKVLEVGFGFRPANTSGGSLFENPQTDYYGLDLPGELVKNWTNWNRKPDTTIVLGNTAVLPFKDNVFDYTLMRSIFGQFTSSSQFWKSNIEHVRWGGVREIFRVLKPGGSIVVAEENTPWDINLVGSYLENAGFSLVTGEFMKNAEYGSKKNSKWRGIREQFFADEPTHGPGYWVDTPYILVAEKPRVIG